MIRYPITDAELRKQIGSTWLASAKSNTDALKKAKAYDKTVVTENWSKIKPVFMKLQHNKCGYCEQKREESAIEFDVEHFRPKSTVKPWHKGSPPSDLAKAVGSVDTRGYHLLAFDYRNYLVSCKTCNTTYKSDAFPVGKKRALNGDDPAACASEQPYLINPVDPTDADPEAVLTFLGVVPVPVNASVRGRTIISFFGLERRDHLRLERLAVIQAMYLAHTSTNPKIRKTISAACESGSPHAACARAYRKLLTTNPTLAEKLAFPD